MQHNAATAPLAQAILARRLLARFRAAADLVMLEGSNPWEIDEALVEFGFALGPYESQDIEGLDRAYAERRAALVALPPRAALIADRMVEEGRLGRKVGVGWYRYPGGGGKVIDPLVEDMAREEARFAGVPRLDFRAEVIRRLVLEALVTAAQDLRAAGEAVEAIDACAVQALHFPAALGGPLRWAGRRSRAQAPG